MKVGKIISNSGTSYQPSLFFRKLFTPLFLSASQRQRKKERQSWLLLSFSFRTKQEVHYHYRSDHLGFTLSTNSYVFCVMHKKSGRQPKVMEYFRISNGIRSLCVYIAYMYPGKNDYGESWKKVLAPLTKQSFNSHTVPQLIFLFKDKESSQ